jgi:hypothetical protein
VLRRGWFAADDGVRSKGDSRPLVVQLSVTPSVLLRDGGELFLPTSQGEIERDAGDGLGNTDGTSVSSRGSVGRAIAVLRVEAP